MSLLELFVSVDDFCQRFLPIWEKKLISEGSKKRRRAGQLSISEIMTILIYFHQSRYRNFKAYYTEHVCQHLKGEFPNLVTYERFVILMPSALGPLSAYLKSLYGRCRGISLDLLQKSVEFKVVNGSDQIETDSKSGSTIAIPLT